MSGDSDLHFSVCWEAVLIGHLIMSVNVILFLMFPSPFLLCCHFRYFLIFNWRIIALQCCVGFSHV